MNVTNLEVGFPNGGYYEFGRPVPFQIALATEGGGRTLSVPMTGAFRGLYQSVNGEMRLLLEYSGELWCEARVTWSPANLLAPAGNPGPFENLDGLLTATGTASGTPGDTGSLTIEILSTNLVTGGVEAIETATHSLQIAELEIGIQGQFVESAAIDVGDTVAPRRFVRTRYEPVVVFFDPSQPLAGKMDIREPSAQTCNLTDVVQPPGAAAAPVALAYSWAQPLGSSSAARFEVPRIVRLTNSSEVQFGSGGAAFVHGRRPGALTLNTMPSLVDADNYDLPTGPSRDDAYTVNPVTLTATFVPAPGDDRDGKLLFEDRWLERPNQPHGGRLVSSFRLEVKRKNETIYRSWDPAVLEFQLQSPGWLKVTSIVRVDSAGLRTRMPFQLSLRSTNPAKVEFWLEGVESGPKPAVRTLDNIMAAVGYEGDCSIHCTLMQLDGEVPIDVDVYDLPAQMRLDVVVPEPLEADLISWEDGYFNGGRERDLDANPTTEVIFAAGSLNGRVNNRNPLSTSEHITLTLASPGDPPRDLTPVFGSGTAAQQARFTSAVTGMTLGDNVLKLEAWKPINLVTTGISTDETTLQGVAPRDVSLQPIDGQQNGGTVLRRHLGRFDFSASRAIRTRLRYENANGTSTLAELDLAYDFDSARFDVTLSQVTGNHVLRAVAENDFDTTESGPFGVFAPAPELSVSFLTGDLPHDPNDSRHVGNSVTELDVRVTTRFTLSYEISFDGTSFLSKAPANPFASGDDTHTVPPGGLAVGQNLFTFPFRNEFASNNRERIIRRRAHVFDVTGRFAIDTHYDSEQEAVVELDEIRPASMMDVAPGFRTSSFGFPFNVTDAASATGFESIAWKVLDGDDDDTPPESMDYRIFLDVVTRDPDFRMLATFMEIAPGDVATGDPDSQEFELGLLADTSGLTLTGGPRFWRQARVLGHSGSLFIPLKTRRLIT